MSGYKAPTAPTPTAARTDHDWQDAAACRTSGDDPDLWHLPQAEPIRDAKAVCLGCDVILECLTTAMTDPSLTGVWGATTDDERKAIRRGRRTPSDHARCGTYSGASRHQKRQEVLCEPCRLARMAYKATRAGVRAEQRAARKAMTA